MENKRGIVINIDPKMLYGTIRGSFGQMLFFHYSDYGIDKQPQIGDQVLYNVVFSTRGPQAINITK